MINNWEKHIDNLKRVNSVEEYRLFIKQLNTQLEEEKVSSEIIKDIKAREKYQENDFSDKINYEKMIESKERLLNYFMNLNQSISNPTQEFEKALESFTEFMDLLRNKQLHKKATLKKECLQSIEIQNEYDLQHLLYAFMKPQFQDMREEVSNDSGLSTNRVDFSVPSIDTILETKCTSQNMSRKALIEALEADIVHYSAKNIYFYIYDKERIIDDIYTFKRYFTRNIDNKNIKIIVERYL